MTDWPATIPDDLRTKLDGIARYRTPPRAAEVWDVVREWLIDHGVQPPDKGDDA